MESLLDFLYLDIERVKSLLSQMKGGVVDTVVERYRSEAEGKAGAKLFTVAEIGGSLVREKATEQTKSLRDYIYIVFEAAAEEAGLFLKHDLQQTENWEGPQRAKLRGGQLVRITSPTRILDAAHFKTHIENTLELPREVAAFVTMQQQTGWSDEFRQLNLQTLGEQMIGGKHVADNMLAMGRFVYTLLSGQIIIRQFPCGLEHKDYNIVGILSDKLGFLQEDRESLFSKYGYELSQWTLVAQIASVPEQPSPEIEKIEVPDITVPGKNKVSRHRFEELANTFMSQIQAIGLAGAPEFPEISVNPIALYHKVKDE
ncbi:MAG: hypothetical protein WA431_07820 [Candidatus Cybelea sp.]